MVKDLEVDWLSIITLPVSHRYNANGYTQAVHVAIVSTQKDGAVELHMINKQKILFSSNLVVHHHKQTNELCCSFAKKSLLSLGGSVRRLGLIVSIHNQGCYIPWVMGGGGGIREDLTEGAISGFFSTGWITLANKRPLSWKQS